MFSEDILGLKKVIETFCDNMFQQFTTMTGERDGQIITKIETVTLLKTGVTRQSSGIASDETD